MRKTVLHIVNDLRLGGAEKVLYTVLKNIDREHFCHVVVTLGKKRHLDKNIQSIGIEVRNLDHDKLTCRNILILFSLLRVYFDYRPGIIHLHLQTPKTLGRIAALIYKACGFMTTIIVTEHNVKGHRTRSQIFLDRILSFKTDKIIACSNSVKEFVIREEGIGNNKVEALYNCIDAEDFVPERKKETVRYELGIRDDNVIASVANLSRQKGHYYLLHAADRVLRVRNNVKFLLVGEGRLRPQLTQLAHELGISEKVIFMGYREDVPDLLNISDIFVLSSLWEGLPMALLEANIMGLPLIATRCAGHEEIVEDGYNGFLVPLRDSQALAEKILFLLENPELAKSLGQNGKKRISEKFTAKEYCRNLEAIYFQLLGGRT